MSSELNSSDKVGPNDGNDRDQWAEALGHLVLALAALDAGNAPPEIGATIDGARHRLQEAIDDDSAE